VDSLDVKAKSHVMQTLTDPELIAEIDEVKHSLSSYDESPSLFTILRELDLGRRQLLGEQVESNPQQIAERVLAMSWDARAEITNRIVLIGSELVDRDYRAQMSREELPQMFNGVKTVNAFYELLLKLQHWSHAELFEALFAIASDCRSYPWPAYAVAADLLIGLDPHCPLTCREALVRLGRAHLEASLQKLPFYLVTQYGKHDVGQETEKLLAEPGLSEEMRQAVSTVRYWSRMPASRLAGHYYFRWHHCEERKDTQQSRGTEPGDDVSVSNRMPPAPGR
jgi:hypothetical protein